MEGGNKIEITLSCESTALVNTKRNFAVRPGPKGYPASTQIVLKVSLKNLFHGGLPLVGLRFSGINRCRYLVPSFSYE